MLTIQLYKKRQFEYTHVFGINGMDRECGKANRKKVVHFICRFRRQLIMFAHSRTLWISVDQLPFAKTSSLTRLLSLIVIGVERARRFIAFLPFFFSSSLSSPFYCVNKFSFASFAFANCTRRLPLFYWLQFNCYFFIQLSN